MLPLAEIVWVPKSKISHVRHGSDDSSSSMRKAVISVGCMVKSSSWTMCHARGKPFSVMNWKNCRERERERERKQNKMLVQHNEYADNKKKVHAPVLLTLEKRRSCVT